MKKQAQASLEIIILIILFVAAGLAMQGYFKRAIEGNWRTSIDSFSDEQYDPKSSKVDYDPDVGPAIVFKDSRLTADIAAGQGNLLDEPDKIIKVNNWGEAW